MKGKGILKKDGKSGKKSIVWDEHAIAQHDLERGGRMKIDEPKTPYIHYSMETDTVHGSSIDPPSMVLADAVEKIQIDTLPDQNDWSSGDEQEKDSVQKKKDFDKKRKLHYNMGKALRHKD